MMSTDLSSELEIPGPMVRAVPIPDRDSVLLWQKADPTCHEYCVRGAIAWPMPRPDPGKPLAIDGCALLFLQDVRDRVIYLLEEREFRTIDHLFGPHYELRAEGLAPWFNEMRTRYGLQTIMWNQDETLHDRWIAEIEGSKLLIKPRPEFLHVPWGEPEQGEMTVREWLARRQIAIAPDTRTYQALRAHQTGDEYAPEMWALMVAVAGYAAFPWIRPQGELQTSRGPFPRNPFFKLIEQHRHL